MRFFFDSIKFLENIVFFYIEQIFSGHFFSKCDFDNVDLHLANLKESYFRNSSLRHVRFDQTNLFGSSLDNVNLYKSYLKETNIQNVKLLYSKLNETIWNSVDFS